jgi:flagellar biosynthesis protein FlhF
MAMTIKSFFADTIAAAIREARAELGEEAMLLKSRRAPDEARHLGAYEVVFGVVQADRREAPASESIWDVSFEASARAAQTAALARPRADALYGKLIELEFDEPLAADFAARVQARLAAEGFSGKDSRAGVVASAEAAVEQAISLEAERFFERNAGLDGRGNGIAALIGPPGGGKTSTVVRLAVAYGLAKGRRVVLLAANDHRVAAAGKLLHYASLLGVECHAACRPQELAGHLNRAQEGDLVLIDTPGYGPRDREHAQSLAEFLAQRPEIQKHLVLPATLKTDDLRAAVERFEVFGTGSLLFTRLDETARFGAAFSEAAACRKPISFLSSGQRVPGDIEAASQFPWAALLRAQEGAMASAA